MTRYGTELGPVAYNPQTRAYEARVTFSEGSYRETYACSLGMPMDAKPETVAMALVRQARELRSRTRVPLRSRLRLGPDGLGLFFGPDAGSQELRRSA